jgi:hypothetical protein
MAIAVRYREDGALAFSWNELTGAVGDAVTVLPIVVAVGALTDLALSTMLVWFGIFQIVWGLYYGVPVSVEPMKALAALVLAGTITAGEFLVAGIGLGAVLLVVGTTGTLARIEGYVGLPVVRGIQFGVALVLLETALTLGVGDPLLATAGVAVLAGAATLVGWNLAALVVLLAGGVVAAATTGIPEPALPAFEGTLLFGAGDLTFSAGGALLAQLAMTVGNAALAASVLLSDFFDRDISADDLSTSMGVMNLAAVPLGAFPMCHGSGGIAGKYSLGARTAGANVILGIGYVAVAVLAASLVAAYPVAMLGVILAVIAVQFGKTSLQRAETYPLVVGVGVLGLLTNLGVAFVAGIVGYHALGRF